jgi:hypothetical protein
MQTEPGASLLHYKLVEKIGEGGLSFIAMEYVPVDDALDVAGHLRNLTLRRLA